MNNRYDEFSRREARDRDRERERERGGERYGDEDRDEERSKREAQSQRGSFYPGDYGSQDWGRESRESNWGRESSWGRESQPYGQREPYNTYRSRWGGASTGDYGNRDYSNRDYGNREFGNRDYGNRGASRYSESQYGQRRPWRDPTGRGYGGGGFRARMDEDYREGHYGSGDFGFERGSRGEPSFGRGYDEGSQPRFFGSGYYGEGGAHYTGGYDPRRQGSGIRPNDWSGDEDYGYGYRGSSGYRGESRREQPGLLRRLFKRGPKGYQRSDERLKEDISERLMQSHDVDSSEVTIAVMAGKVTLEGTVPDRYMKHYIEDLVDACPGVQDIENRIRVDATSGMSTQTGTTTTGTTTTTSAQSTASGLGSNGGRRKE
jgi:BON domain